MLTLTGSIVLCIAMDPLIETVFGRFFVGAIPSARVLSLAAVMISLARVFHGLLKGIGRPLDAARSEGGALLVTAAGLAVLLPPFGIMGAAITSLLAYTTSVIIGAVLAISALEVPASELLWRRAR
jgi:O-antigen/teichoic acid export membrane protein